MHDSLIYYFILYAFCVVFIEAVNLITPADLKISFFVTILNNSFTII